MQEIFPIISFIAAYLIAKWSGNSSQAIYWATIALMFSSVLQLIWLRLRRQPIEKKHWLTALVILTIGSITLVFKNPMIIKWKPSITYLIFSAVLLVVQWSGKGNIVHKMLGSVFTMPNSLWNRLNIIWALFFIIMAILNLVVAYNFSDDFWVGFKLWGGLGGMLLFMIVQVFLLRRYLNNDDKTHHE